MQQILDKLPALFYYAYNFSKVNFGLSLFFTLISGGITGNVLLVFSVIFLSAGFGVTLVFIILRGSSEIYFYLNKGFRKAELFTGVYIISFLTIIILNLIINSFI